MSDAASASVGLFLAGCFKRCRLLGLVVGLLVEGAEGGLGE